MADDQRAMYHPLVTIAIALASLDTPGQTLFARMTQAQGREFGATGSNDRQGLLQNRAGTRQDSVRKPLPYPDARPVTHYRLEAKDYGIVYRHGNGPRGCDSLGARDVWVWQHEGTYYMHYDGAGARGDTSVAL